MPLTPSGSAIKRGVKRGRCVIEITVTWSLILPTPAEMRVSGSENFQNWRRIDFLFLQNQKIGRPVGLFFPGSKNRAAVRLPQQDSASELSTNLHTFAAQGETLKRYRGSGDKRCRTALRRLASLTAHLTGMPRSEIVRRGLTRISGTAHDLIG